MTSDLDPPFVAEMVAPPKSFISGDWIVLVASTLVIGLAMTMSIRDQSQVLAPGTGFALPELCNFRRVFNLDCPGCGMTRAFISVGHGDWLAAWRYNPASIPTFAMVAFQIPFRLAQIWRARRGREPLSLGGWGYYPLVLLIVVMLGQWVTRVLLGFG